MLVLFHKEVALSVLALLAARLAWRLTHVLPQLAAHLPDWKKIAARFVHLCFYALMFAMPVTAWLMSSAGTRALGPLFQPLADIIVRVRTALPFTDRFQEAFRRHTINITNCNSLGAHT